MRTPRTAVSARRKTIADALALLRRAVDKVGHDAVAELIPTVPVTVRRWMNGDNAPTEPMARRILEKLAGVGT